MVIASVFPTPRGAPESTATMGIVVIHPCVYGRATTCRGVTTVCGGVVAIRSGKVGWLVVIVDIGSTPPSLTGM